MIQQFIRIDNPFYKPNPFYAIKSNSTQKISQSYKGISPSHKISNLNKNNHQSYSNLNHWENKSLNYFNENNQISMLSKYHQSTEINKSSKYQQSSLKKQSKKLENPFFRKSLLQTKDLNIQQKLLIQQCFYQARLLDFSNLNQQDFGDKKIKISPTSNENIESIRIERIILESEVTKFQPNMPSKSLIASFSRVKSQKTQKSIKDHSLSKVPSVQRFQKPLSIQKLSYKNIDSQPDIITLRGKLYSKIEIIE